jgi:hypothetical protein
MNPEEGSNRPDAGRTIVVLNAGTLVAVVAFAGGFVIRLAAQSELADQVSGVAVIALLATPAVALAMSAFELRRAQRIAASMAVLVLAVLAAATMLALLTR